jgi:hypothetical protein
MRFYNRLAIAAAIAPLVMFFLDLPAILLGVDRMNEIDRVTLATLWISLGRGLIAGGSLIWLVLFKSKRESLGFGTYRGHQGAASALYGAPLDGRTFNVGIRAEL